jgi:hypothetical protein
MEVSQETPYVAILKSLVLTLKFLTRRFPVNMPANKMNQ